MWRYQEVIRREEPVPQFVPALSADNRASNDGSTVVIFLSGNHVIVKDRVLLISESAVPATLVYLPGGILVGAGWWKCICLNVDKLLVPTFALVDGEACNGEFHGVDENG